MPSQLDVINQVLIEIGNNPVSNIKDDFAATKIANKLTVLLPVLLSRTSWDFALKFVIDNNPIYTTPNSEFNYTYQLPGDYGRLDRFDWFYGSSISDNFRISDGQIFTNNRPVRYSYVVKTISYADCSALFIDTLVLFTASRMALALTQKEELTAYLNKQYEASMIDAIRQNDMERNVRGVAYNSYNRVQLI